MTVTSAGLKADLSHGTWKSASRRAVTVGSGGSRQHAVWIPAARPCSSRVGAGPLDTDLVAHYPPHISSVMLDKLLNAPSLSFPMHELEIISSVQAECRVVGRGVRPRWLWLPRRKGGASWQLERLSCWVILTSLSSESISLPVLSVLGEGLGRLGEQPGSRCVCAQAVGHLWGCFSFHLRLDHTPTRKIPIPVPGVAAAAPDCRLCHQLL